MPESSWPLQPLPWQQESWRQLVKQRQEDRLPHALLLTGSAGIGKRHFARALAAFLLCHQAVGEVACGQCKSCRLLQAGTHRDLRLVGIEQGSRQIKVAQIRQISEFANQTAVLGSHQVVLLESADAMNPNASNALLKTLEEPTANTSLLLIADDVSRLLATLRSRCQRLPMADPSRAQSRQWLRQVCGDDEMAGELLVAAADRPLLAQEILLAGTLGRHQSLRGHLESLLRGESTPLDFPGLVADEELTGVFDLFCGHVQERIRQRLERDGPDLTKLLQLLDYLQRERRAVRSGANPNRQLCIEAAALRLLRVLGPVHGSGGEA